MEYAQCTGTGLSGDIWCAGIFLHFRIFVRRQYENLASVLEAESDDTFCHGSAVRHYCGSMWCSGRRNQCVCMAVVPAGISSHDVLSYNISGILRALLENT